MRYKMSSDISSVFPCLRFLLPMHIRYPLFILQSSRTLFPFSACYLFLPLISPRTLSFLSSSFHLLPIPPTSLLPPLPPSLPLSIFWTFLLVLSVSLHPLFPPSFPCDEWVCLLGAVHIYWAGERTLSVSLALHISIPPLKRQREQEVTVGWEEEGGRGQVMHSRSHHDSSRLGGEHVSLDQHSFSVQALEVVEGERNLPHLLTNLSMWWY